MMTKEQQRIAIAEWRGYKPDPDSTILHGYIGPNGEFVFPDKLPNNPNDLNAMHKALGWLTEIQKDCFVTYLFVLTGMDLHRPRPKDFQIWFAMVTSSAEMQSEALCRTLWPERFETTKGEV